MYMSAVKFKKPAYKLLTIVIGNRNRASRNIILQELLSPKVANFWKTIQANHNLNIEIVKEKKIEKRSKIMKMIC